MPLVRRSWQAYETEPKGAALTGFCAKLMPDDITKMRQAITDTQTDGHERFFVKCTDGTSSPLCVGDERQCQIDRTKVCGGRMFGIAAIMHTHPSDSYVSPYLSRNDLIAGRRFGGICLGYEWNGGRKYVKCADGEKIDYKELQEVVKEFDDVYQRAKVRQYFLNETHAPQSEMIGHMNEANVKLADVLAKFERKYQPCNIEITDPRNLQSSMEAFLGLRNLQISIPDGAHEIPDEKKKSL